MSQELYNRGRATADQLSKMIAEIGTEKGAELHLVNLLQELGDAIVHSTAAQYIRAQQDGILQMIAIAAFSGLLEITTQQQGAKSDGLSRQ